MDNRDVFAEIIGVGVHTGLRKFTNSKAAINAWRAIADMPDEEWDAICYLVADDIIHYLRSLETLKHV